MYSLPNQPVATADGYKYFDCPQGARFTIQVFGSNPVDVGLGTGFPAPQFVTADVYLAQTTWVDSIPVDQIRFKSHLPGKPGQITITVFSEAEVGKEPAPGGLFPNYLSLNPDGTLDAVFSGIVHASGGEFDGDITADSLQLLEEPWPGSDLPPSDSSEIEWRVVKDGTVREGVFGAQKRFLKVDGSGLLVGAHIGVRTELEDGSLQTVYLANPRGQNFIRPASQDPDGSDLDLRLTKEYQIVFDTGDGSEIPAGATVSPVVHIDEGIAGFFQILGYLNQQGGGFLDQSGWAVSNVVGNDITFVFHNHNAVNDATGAFVFRVLMAS